MRHPHHKTAGFTLIELLVVLVIMGVMISLVTLSIGIQNRERETHQFALRLISLMRLASDEAVLNGKLIGWQIDQQQYRFMQRQEGKWITVADDRLFKPNPIPSWIHSDFEVEGRAVEQLQSPEQPQLLFLPSGEITSFRLELFDGLDMEAVHFRLQNRYADLGLTRIEFGEQ